MDSDHTPQHNDKETPVLMDTAPLSAAVSIEIKQEEPKAKSVNPYSFYSLPATCQKLNELGLQDVDLAISGPEPITMLDDITVSSDPGLGFLRRNCWPFC